MMFYLKYRPQRISELDNKKIRESLGQALLSNKWAHAYLLVGPKGTGKTTTARLIAKIVNCANRNKGEEPCNRCSSCKTITSGTSLDVIEIDAASNTGVDDIRDLREKAKLAPTASKYKVYIIDEVHMLSTSAFNALLKILEEPPEHVIFVLATTDPQKMPATVVSRCLVYNFGETTREDVVRKLQKISIEEKIKVKEEVLIQIVETVGMSHRDAQKLLEQMTMGSANGKVSDLAVLTAQIPNEYVNKLLQALGDKDVKEAIGLVNGFVEKDGKLKDFIVALMSTLRTILLSRNIDASYDGNIKISNEEVLWLIDKLTVANGLLRDSPIPQLPLEMMIVEFCKQKLEVGSVRLDTEVGSEKLGSQNISPQNPVSRVPPPTSGVLEKWPQVLSAVKPYNHSLVALLRASRPKEIVSDTLTLEVFYKFHKEKLEERKNRDILEKVLSDIMGRTIKVKFVLAEKK